MSNKTLLKRVSELEAKVEEDKRIILEATGKDAEIKRLEKSREEAASLAESRATEMEKSKGALLPCTREAKVILDGVFTKGGMTTSEELPEADLALFADWLLNEIAQFQLLLKGSHDVGGDWFGVHFAAVGL